MPALRVVALVLSFHFLHKETIDFKSASYIFPPWKHLSYVQSERKSIETFTSGTKNEDIQVGPELTSFDRAFSLKDSSASTIFEFFWASQELY